MQAGCSQEATSRRGREWGLLLACSDTLAAVTPLLLLGSSARGVWGVGGVREQLPAATKCARNSCAAAVAVAVARSIVIMWCDASILHC